jgi:cytidylate kinase
MAVITISRQVGSGGVEIAVRVCQMLGYLYFDKELMARMAAEVGLSTGEIVDFSEDNHKVKSFLERMFGWRWGRRITAPVPHEEVTERLGQTRYPMVGVAEMGFTPYDVTEVGSEAVAALDQERSLVLVRGAILAAYENDNVVIVGRGGQAILKEKPDVLHVRVQSPLEARNQRLHQQLNVTLAAAQDIALKHDRAATDYLKRFYNVDWADPMLYDLVINTGKLDIEAAAHLIVNAISYLPAAEAIR